MSEPTREEMLEWLDGQAEGTEQRFGDLLKTHDDLYPEKKKLDDAVIRMLQYDLLIIRAIRCLIETRPRVTRGFVEKWAERMSFDTGSILGKVKPQIYQLEEMLKEAGVEMEEEYKEA